MDELKHAARAAKLHYVIDTDPGIQRQKQGSGFKYLDSAGKLIKDKDERARIEALVIPPAWSEVWICPDSEGHIQATGRDAKGRKQYRYHPRWNEIRSENKFSRLTDFGAALPQLRETTEEHLRKRDLSREKVLAIVVRLLETTLIRVGNPEYARSNESYGLTTLEDDHISIHGSKLQFQFRGKSGKDHEIDITDKRLAKMVKACQEIPGQHLFQYYDSEGEPHPVQSGDVNAYLREITGQEFSAKDFRTWGGSVLALETLAALPTPENETETKKFIAGMVKEVAALMGNTPAVCRKYYIHPAVIEAFVNGKLEALIAKQPEPATRHDLSQSESALLSLLR